MSKPDEKYIIALENFTNALGEVVKTLKEQQKTNKSDSINEFLKAPMNELVNVVKDLKKVTQKGFKDVKTDNQKILKKIDGIKQQKESGMFGQISDKNKDKIVDGIKVVVLIAAGVLALGLAFKIIGKVDFLSVIALSAGMLLMAVTFVKISELKGLKIGEMFNISAILPIMALGLLASGIILSLFPAIGFAQGMSMILVGATMGVAALLLLSSLDKIKNISDNWTTIAALPIMLPLIALGLFASWFFSELSL